MWDWWLRSRLRLKLVSVLIEPKILAMLADLDSQIPSMSEHLPEGKSIVLESGIIFVDNDALAFFNVNDPPNESMYVAKSEHNPPRVLYDQPYDLLVGYDRVNYFITEHSELALGTVSVTSPCIVFGAFTTDGDGKIKSSGVYHAASMPPSKFFKNRMHTLIDTVRTEHGERVVVKAAGGNEEWSIDGSIGLWRIRKDIKKILAEEGVERGSDYVLLGGRKMRITEFDTRTGELITYFNNSIRRTVL